MAPSNLEAWAAGWQAALDALLRDRTEGAWPEALSVPLAYPLFTGGKRIRPAFVLAAWEALGDDRADSAPALPAAAAVELVHTYSLVHDDLPSMDDDDTRRGRPTLHRAHGEGVAILVGDALLTEAFSVLAEGPWSPEVRLALLTSLAQAAGHRGMVGGQAADIGLAGPVTEVETLLALHRRKTGALISWSVEAGGRIAAAPPEAQAALATYGARVGLAFQLADDWLDREEDAGEEGPPSFVRLLGAEETRRRALALATEAAEAVEGLPRPETLQALARFTVERER